MKQSLYLVLLGLATLAIGCKSDPKGQPKEETKTEVNKPRVKVPRFNSDSTYAFIEKQLSFGTRVPGSEGSRACQAWIEDKLKGYGVDVLTQPFKANFLGRTNVQSYNIIGTYNPEKKERVLLCAHWDTRLIAEKDPEESKRDEAILGADDGASGVAVLLEIARQISMKSIDLGVDLVFFDAEDNGEDSDGWCQGSQYWSRTPHIKNYNAEFGILLDMVGAKKAQFQREGWSVKFAPKVVDKVWKLAQGMGNGDRFIDQQSGAINDDHYYVNKILGIPTIDIINRPYPATNEYGFGDYHHTHDDNIDVIDKRTLQAVGQVVTAVIYKTSDGTLR